MLTKIEGGGYVGMAYFILAAMSTWVIPERVVLPPEEVKTELVMLDMLP